MDAAPGGEGGSRMSRAAPVPPRSHTLAVTAFRLRELGIARSAGLPAIVFFAVRSDAFFTSSNWQDIALNVATVVVVAVGQTMVVLTRASTRVGSTWGLSAFVSADTLSAHNWACPIALMGRARRWRRPRSAASSTVSSSPFARCRRSSRRSARSTSTAASCIKVSGGSQVLASSSRASFKTFAVREVLGIPALAVDRESWSRSARRGGAALDALGP